MSGKDIAAEECEERRIGVISDTHGVVRDLLHDVLAGVEVIFHAGDVCGENVLDELSLIAPVIAVQGNMDYANRYNPPLPVYRYVDIGFFRFSIAHNIIDLNQGLKNNKSENLTNIAIFGHTHIPENYRENDIYFMNPGSCGPKRQGKPVSYSIINLKNREVTTEIYTI
jgi:putative phosphoesterase